MREMAAHTERGTARGTRRMLLGTAVAGALALWNRQRARRAELEHPPTGRFIEVHGIKLHFLEEGTGTAVVLLHGNGTRAEDFRASGLLDRLARHHRVVAFDRPGYGFSERPRDRAWTPEQQAELVNAALQQLGIHEAVVVGHSWGTLVALALALNYPQQVRGLVLLSGYYYPTLRLDVPFFAPPAIPGIGDLMRYTISPLVGKLLTPLLVRQLFAPSPVPERFEPAVPLSLMLRPWQLRASAEESALLIPAAARLRRRYRDLRVPLKLIAGAKDRYAFVRRHSARLHREIRGSELRVMPELGHMVHYFAQDHVVGAVEDLAQPARTVNRGA
jgi:pimeloyl-ACP methyl ester carboxylesterase